LLLVEERLLEAEYFLKRLRRLASANHFQFEMNAFLSASRSVTWLLQKEMSGVPGFENWWKEQQRTLGNDKAARFFKHLRNLSQHESRIAVVGAGRRRGWRLCWSYRFAGGNQPVPNDLLHRDVAECCGEHLAKLAKVVLACADQFPFFTCPKRTLTPAGVETLGITIEDVEETLGFPRGCTAVGTPASDDRRLEELRRHVDGVNFRSLKRLSRLRATRSKGTTDPALDFGDALTASIVENLGTRDGRPADDG
jgi:hypothetical protein